MDKDKLVELAERCEAATAPDRKLDRDIALMLFDADPPSFPGFASAEAQGAMREVARKLVSGKCYTASIDAALTLAPDGWAWMTGCDVDEPFFATLAPTDESGITADDVETKAATPALALCAAALRAASADTLPQGQALLRVLAGTESGAVPEGQTPIPSSSPAAGR